MTIKSTPPVVVGGDFTWDNTDPGQTDSVIGTAAYYDTGAWSSFTMDVIVLTAAGTSPTLDITVQASNIDPDNASHDPWDTLKAVGQFTAAGRKTIRIPDGSGIDAWGRYIRIVGKVGGADHVLTGRIDISPRG